MPPKKKTCGVRPLAEILDRVEARLKGCENVSIELHPMAFHFVGTDGNGNELKRAVVKVTSVSEAWDFVFKRMGFREHRKNP